MVVKLRGLLCLCAVLLAAGCANLSQAQTPLEIALLAPFEGRYREIGYEALYAARLAIAENGQNITLLPLDDGGSIKSAQERIQAIQRDPQVQAIITTGPYATQAQVQATLEDLPMIIVGYWPSESADAQAFIFGSENLTESIDGTGWESLTAAARLEAPFSGGDVLAMPAFTALREDLTGIQLISNGTLPDEDFHQRIMVSDQFASAPRLLSTRIYDAVWIAIQAMHTSADRQAVTAALQNETFTIMAGEMHFSGNYWADAPLNTFIFDASGTLEPINPSQ